MPSYDSYVQLFFKDLVKFVSASRNMMRKAVMAAKVAQIKRLAMEMLDESDGEEAEPSTPTQSRGLVMAQAALGLEKDIYDDLDKGLEFIQSMCEHTAHQSLLVDRCDWWRPRWR